MTPNYPILVLPPIPLTLLILSRSASVSDTYLHYQKTYGEITLAKPKKLFYTEDLEAWKDRAKDVHVVVIQQHADPIYFREQAARMKLFFPFMDIIKPLH